MYVLITYSLKLTCLLCCALINELMMKGDTGQTKRKKKKKFHAVKNATSPVSYNQHDYED